MHVNIFKGLSIFQERVLGQCLHCNLHWFSNYLSLLATFSSRLSNLISSILTFPSILNLKSQECFIIMNGITCMRKNHHAQNRTALRYIFVLVPQAHSFSVKYVISVFKRVKFPKFQKELQMDESHFQQHFQLFSRHEMYSWQSDVQKRGIQTLRAPSYPRLLMGLMVYCATIARPRKLPMKLYAYLKPYGYVPFHKDKTRKWLSQDSQVCFRILCIHETLVIWLTTRSR